MNKKMRKWQLSPKFGRGNLELMEVPVPAPSENEVLVRVSAVSLNYRDKLIIENGMGLTAAESFTPGSDMAGTVVALGSGVKRFRNGDPVLSVFSGDWIDGLAPGHGRELMPALGAPSLPGVLAEYVALPEQWLVHAPSSLTAVQASTLPCAAVTAWQALVELGGLRPGQNVVVQGTGGVSLFAVQFAIMNGAKVIVISGDDEKLARVKRLGVSRCINRHSTPEWAQAVIDATDGRGADHILEMVGADNLARSIDALVHQGRISLVGVFGGMLASLPVGAMLKKRATIQGIGVGPRRVLEEVIRAIDRSAIKPVIAGQYGLGDLDKALDELDRGPFGKIVIQIAAE
ncbi:MAG: zinc-dependent alcohol dehydrogenase family protein [Terriglobales bacterium]